MRRVNIKNIKDRINGNNVKIDDMDSFIAEMHHIFMKSYGYVSVDDFLNIPFITFFNLLNILKRESRNNKSVLK